MTRIRGLIVDFGGVLTTSLRDAFRTFSREEGIEEDRMRRLMEGAYHDGDPDSIVSMVETGRMPLEEFERRLAEALSEGLHRPVSPEGLLGRMLGRLEPDIEMIEAVRRARESGILTALLSNSWGHDMYPQELLDDLFDQVVISGKVGVRKPDLEAYAMAAERLGLRPEECVFVDDAKVNAEAAGRAGMHGVFHEETPRTIAELERLLGVALSAPA